MAVNSRLVIECSNDSVQQATKLIDRKGGSWRYRRIENQNVANIRRRRWSGHTNTTHPLRWYYWVCPTGSREHALRYLMQDRGLSRSPDGSSDAQLFAQHARSGSDRVTVSTAPLRRRSHRSRWSYLNSNLFS